MNAQITIPYPISEAAEHMAQQLGLSLSELYTLALTQYMANQQTLDITLLLNQVYATEDSSLDPVLLEIQMASIDEEVW